MNIPKLSSLSPEQKNILIGEVCGDFSLSYTTSLDAMHEAEKALPTMDKGSSSMTKDYPSVQFTIHLGQIVGLELRAEQVFSEGIKNGKGKGVVLETYVHASPFESWKLTHATAMQRADSFLLATGKAEL